jgi:hypothetical protein
VCKLNACSAAVGDTDIHIHGWDSTGWFWHELTDIVPEAYETGAMLRKLRKAPAAFQGKCRVPGSPVFEFQTTAYDVTDAGLAIVHLDGAPGGPIAALTVIPAHRRPRLRNEFAFGFVAHLSFLDGLINPDSQLAIHDYVENLLLAEPTSTLVFTVETARACSDTSIVLSAYLEKLSIAMLQWLCAKDAEAESGRRERLDVVPRAAQYSVAAVS